MEESLLDLVDPFHGDFTLSKSDINSGRINIKSLLTPNLVSQPKIQKSKNKKHTPKIEDPWVRGKLALMLKSTKISSEKKCPRNQGFRNSSTQTIRKKAKKKKDCSKKLDPWIQQKLDLMLKKVKKKSSEKGENPAQKCKSSKS